VDNPRLSGNPDNSATSGCHARAHGEGSQNSEEHRWPAGGSPALSGWPLTVRTGSQAPASRMGRLTRHGRRNRRAGSVRHRPGICLARQSAFRSLGWIAAMSQDEENAELRARLNALWRTACELFGPLPPKMNADRSGDNHPESKPDAENTKSLHRTGIQPSYVSGWRNLASVVSLVGSAMFGASFNFLDHNNDVAFFGVSGFGIIFMLSGVWATTKHDRLEREMRASDSRIENEARAMRTRGEKILKVAGTYLNTIRPLMQSSVDEDFKLQTIIMSGVSMLTEEERIDLLTHISDHGLLPPRLSRIRESLERTFPENYFGPTLS
jgi:hypothetical protein